MPWTPSGVRQRGVQPVLAALRERLAEAEAKLERPQSGDAALSQAEAEARSALAHPD